MVFLQLWDCWGDMSWCVFTEESRMCCNWRPFLLYRETEVWGRVWLPSCVIVHQLQQTLISSSARRILALACFTCPVFRKNYFSIRGHVSGQTKTRSQSFRAKSWLEAAPFCWLKVCLCLFILLNLSLIFCPSRSCMVTLNLGSTQVSQSCCLDIKHNLWTEPLSRAKDSQSSQFVDDVAASLLALHKNIFLWETFREMYQFW